MFPGRQAAKVAASSFLWGEDSLEVFPSWQDTRLFCGGPLCTGGAGQAGFLPPQKPPEGRCCFPLRMQAAGESGPWKKCGIEQGLNWSRMAPVGWHRPALGPEEAVRTAPWQTVLHSTEPGRPREVTFAPWRVAQQAEEAAPGTAKQAGAPSSRSGTLTEGWRGALMWAGGSRGASEECGSGEVWLPRAISGGPGTNAWL